MSMKHERRRNMHRVALALPVLVFAAPAFACTVTATGFQFGVIDPLIATTTTSTSTITVNCPAPTSYMIALSPGSGTFAERLMTSGTNTLSYNLYADAAHTIIWGDGTAGTSTVNGSASTAGSTHTVYGRAPHQPTAVPGVYSDSIVVTLSF